MRSARAHSLQGEPGTTLIEILVASAVLAIVSVVLFGAFTSTAEVRSRLGKSGEREHTTRMALARITRDIRSAFLSSHVNTDSRLNVMSTGFIGQSQTAGDRIDMTTFSHRRLMRASHEGDACEVGYRVEPSKEHRGVDLLRRESVHIDNEIQRGGVTDVFLADIKSFEIRYFDSYTEKWIDTWDTTQSVEQFGRLPGRVRVTIRLPGDGLRERSEFVSEAVPMIPEMLRFGLPVDFK